MNKIARLWWCAVALVVCGMCAGCYTVPVTGRTAFVAVSETEETQLGLQAYTDAKQKTPIAKDAAATARVAAIGRRIAAVSQYPGWNWEFTVFDQPDVPNAWCLPGGKVGVYNGIFPYAKTDGELATVMAHEIGHAVARHGGERMSEEMVLAAGSAVLVGSVSQQNVEKVKVAYGLGSQLFCSLPHSRAQEYEADQIGLVYMARAGYDPREALTFWDRFSKALSASGKPPEFLSTHPADANRIAKIKALLPAALQEYDKARATAPRSPAVR